MACAPVNDRYCVSSSNLYAILGPHRAGDLRAASRSSAQAAVATLRGPGFVTVKYVSICTMQIIETSVIGVRSAVITFRRPDTPMQIVLFPMLHLGTKGFYKAVTARLRECQLVVAEGHRRIG